MSDEILGNDDATARAALARDALARAAVDRELLARDPTAHEVMDLLDLGSESPGLALWHAENRWQAKMRATLKPYELTHVQFALLAHLTWLAVREPERTLTQIQLAEFAATDPMMTSQVLRALERKDLVERRVDPGDRRVRLVSLTDEGRELTIRAAADVKILDQEFFGSVADPRELHAQLARLGCELRES